MPILGAGFKPKISTKRRKRPFAHRSQDEMAYGGDGSQVHPGLYTDIIGCPEVIQADVVALADAAVVVEEDGEDSQAEEETEEEGVVAVVALAEVDSVRTSSLVFDDSSFFVGGRGGVAKRGGDRGGRGGGGRGARGAGRGGRGAGGRGGARGGSNVIVEPHKHPGVFIAKGKESMLVTKNLVPGESVYGEKRISVEGGVEGTKIEYRVWNPFRSKLAAGILGGMDHIHIEPGKKVLYLGAASGTSVSHVADVVGPVCTFPLSFFPPLTLS